MRYFTRCGVLLLMMMAAMVPSMLPATSGFCQPVSNAESSYPAVYTGQIIPTADPAESFTAAAHLLTFPPVLLLQAATPATKWMTPIGFVAGGPWPLAGYGSVAIRFHLFRPGPRRWGVAFQPQLIGISGAANAEWLNAYVATVFQGVISSPLRPWRAHVGAALHTMPGEERYYHNDVFMIRKYDFKNMQTTVFGRGEVTTHNKKATFFIEGFWLATGTRDPEDSFALALVGIRFRFGKTWLSVSSGLVHFGKKISISDSGGFHFLPVPPLLSVIVRL
jgi:hypothetical protein